MGAQTTAGQCRRRGCAKCKYKHHTSICDRQERENSSPNGVSLTGYTNYAAERVLPAIIPVSIEGQVLWAYLDTASGRNFISREAVKMLKLKPTRHETREILTVNGTKVQSMPIFDTRIESLDGKSCEEIEYTLAYTRQEVLYDVYRRIPDTSHSWRQHLQQNKDGESVQREARRALSRRDNVWLGGPWWR